MPEPPIEDPLFAGLATWWDDVLRLADDERRARIVELVGSGPEVDPVDVRAELAELLIGILPAEHPLLAVVGGALLYSRGTTDVVDLALSKEVLRAVVSRVGTPPEPDDADWFDREVEARLLALPAAVASGPVPPGLIRLPRQDGRGNVPTFQYDGAGEPYEVVLDLNADLGAEDDPWGVACWWVDRHAALAAAPKDLLGSGRDAALRAAAEASLEDL